MAPAVYSIIPSSPLDLAPPAPSLNPEPASTASSLSGFERLSRRALAQAEVIGGDWAVPSAVARAGGADMARGVEAAALGGRMLSRRDLAPTDTQKVTLGVIGAYAVVITILWNIPVVNYVLWPFKMLTIGFHEFGHAATGCCTGAKIKSITLDPREGGCTMMAGGISAITLPAGYVGSALIGALLVFCGFDIVASKVASIIVGVCFLLTLWWGRKDWLTWGTILFATGLLVAFWFIAHGAALRFYILFIGTMSGLYALYDIFDDLIARKINESDASVFAKRYGGSSACWGVVWVIISLALLACGIVGGLAAFKDSWSEQQDASESFLPTRLMLF
ncbi:hypothetical protein JCM8547_006312 [Rhodosporidiobolus lusitaniae]